MTDLDDIARRLSEIEETLKAISAWMHEKIGAEKAEEQAMKRRAWVDRLASGIVVGTILSGVNWWLG